MRAAELSPNRADRSRRLADTAYTGARLAGDLDRAAELLRDARRRDPTIGETLHAAVATSYLLLNSDGNPDTAAHLLLAAIGSALDEPDDRRDGLADAMYMLLLVCHYAASADYWTSFHEAMRRLRPDDAPEVRLMADTFADPLSAPARSLDALDDEIQKLRDVDDAVVIIRCAIAGFYIDRLAGCREALWRVVRDGREGGAVRPAMTGLAMIAFGEFGAGRWDEADRLAAESTGLCEERGFRLMAWTGRYATALIAGNRGDRRACEAICHAMAEWATPRRLGHLHEFAHHALAQAALGDGDFEQGYVHASAISPPGVLGSHATQALWAALDLVDAAVHTGRDDEANAHVEAMWRADLGRLSPRFALVAVAVAAMVAPDDEAPDRFREALALPAVEEWPFEVARVRLSYGERLRRLRRIRAARTQLEAARDGFELLGARPWMQRAQTELGATGASRRQVRGGGTESLTVQEREVALLAATGLTNREIAARLYVSPRTVSAHLYRIFPKLGITSRAALRDALSSALGVDVTS
jgi:DNA-binding CsgD family transcriptional regulator